ncbi:MAG: hypothetical protein JEY91_01145 [Spirochaetaceae bacterium]|nr:hypothetical protein [Spirochaetaceae bacterium]
MKKIENAHVIPYYDRKGEIDALQPLEECSVVTSIGNLIPIYQVDDHGRKKLSPVKYHKNGNIRSISLQTPIKVSTSIGPIEGELITFYADGSLCRIFPLNGKLSGYWSETNEYKLADILSVNTSVGLLEVKAINIQFYHTGELKSITLWPGERPVIRMDKDDWIIRKGISFYRNGKLQSCEPALPIHLETKIGVVEAYDPDPNGIDGNKNSLVFSETGKVINLSTSGSKIKVCDEWGTKYSFEPGIIRSHCSDDRFAVEPLKIRLEEELVIFQKGLRATGKVHLKSHFTTEEFHSGLNLQGEILHC